MKVRLFFIFISLLFNVNARYSCEGIAESIGTCKEYSCTQFIDDKNSVEHKILGLNSENLCVYIEKQGNDEMVCHHSKHGMIMEKKYFENIFKIGNQRANDFIDIAQLRAKECFFISSQKQNYTDRDNMIREAVDNDSEVLSQYNDIESIFFDKKSVDRMIDEMERFNLGSSTIVNEQIVDNFNCTVVGLNSILYFSPDTWKIWVNGKLFINTKDLKVHSVTENHVTFIWTVDQVKQLKEISSSQNVYFGHGSIMFTLYPKQKFDLDSLSIQ